MVFLSLYVLSSVALTRQRYDIFLKQHNAVEKINSPIV